jgi:MerR family transcriptional regulator, light-induced transcriptional regulator
VNTLRSGSGGGQPPLAPEPLWSLAAVTKATGIGAHTLRAWERRYGFPKPLRLPSGHRRFTPAQITHLRLIGQALAMGHRAGTVVPLPVESLRRLLGGGQTVTRPSPTSPDFDLLFEAAYRYDREAVVGAFQRWWAELGLSAFLKERMAPLSREVGAAWAEGRLDIRHEHFLTELMEDTLRSLRMTLEPASEGAPLLLATLPGEHHRLGLQMAALAAALHRRRVRLLGTQCPIPELLEAAFRLDAAAVGLTVAGSSAFPETALAVAELRAKLPPHIQLWIGGAGGGLLGDLPDGVLSVHTLEEMEGALAAL